MATAVESMGRSTAVAGRDIECGQTEGVNLGAAKGACGAAGELEGACGAAGKHVEGGSGASAEAASVGGYGGGSSRPSIVVLHHWGLLARRFTALRQEPSCGSRHVLQMWGSCAEVDGKEEAKEESEEAE